MPEISIIIPNKNNACFLDDCLNSVLTQTFRDWECIIIDDGSTDDSVKIIKRFCKKDKRFRLIEQKSRGVSVARNVGLDNISGKWCCFLDSDDVLLHEAFETMLYGVSVMNYDIIEADSVFVHKDFVSHKYNPSFSPANIEIFNFDDIYEGISKYSNNIAWVWRRLYRTDLAKMARFPENIQINEDLLWFMDILSFRPRIAKVKATVLWHRIWDNSLTRAAGAPGRLEELTTVIDRIAKNDKIPKHFCDYVIHNLLFCMIQYDCHEVQLSKKIISPKLRKKLWTYRKRYRRFSRAFRRFIYAFLIKQFFLYMAYGKDKNEN